MTSSKFGSILLVESSLKRSISWEYPGKQGNTANQVSPDDSANFLAMLQQLKATDVGSNLKISAAVTLTPFVGADGQPMSDVSEFAKVIDFIGKSVDFPSGAISDHVLRQQR